MINVRFDFSSRLIICPQVGEMFIVCGVLYAVDSVTERNTKIRLALDLYRNNVVDDVNLAFTNPFKKTTTVGYNHRTKVSRRLVHDADECNVRQGEFWYSLYTRSFFL